MLFNKFITDMQMQVSTYTKFLKQTSSIISYLPRNILFITFKRCSMFNIREDNETDTNYYARILYLLIFDEYKTLIFSQGQCYIKITKIRFDFITQIVI